MNLFDLPGYLFKFFAVHFRHSVFNYDETQPVRHHILGLVVQRDSKN